MRKTYITLTIMLAVLLNYSTANAQFVQTKELWESRIGKTAITEYWMFDAITFADDTLFDFSKLTNFEFSSGLSYMLKPLNEMPSAHTFPGIPENQLFPNSAFGVEFFEEEEGAVFRMRNYFGLETGYLNLQGVVMTVQVPGFSMTSVSEYNRKAALQPFTNTEEPVQAKDTLITRDLLGNVMTMTTYDRTIQWVRDGKVVLPDGSAEGATLWYIDETEVENAETQEPLTYQYKTLRIVFESGEIEVELPENFELNEEPVQIMEAEYRFYQDAAATNTENDEENTPSVFILEGNYPNPFNPSTQIAFTLERSSEVQLDVYNMLGQKVWQAPVQRYGAGSHTIRFNGAGLPSGIYLYRIQASGQVQTAWMTLLK